MTDHMTNTPDTIHHDRVRILGIPAILMALLFSVTWIAAVLAYGWGFFDLGSKSLSSPSSWGIAPHIIAAFVVIAVLPVAFIWMTVITLGRAAAMTRASNDLARAARRLTNPVTYMGEGARTVIAELDQEFGRLKSEVSAIDQMLAETHERISGQISLLKSAGEDAGEQATNLQKHLGEEREALQELARMIGNEGARISANLDASILDQNDRPELGSDEQIAEASDQTLPDAPPVETEQKSEEEQIDAKDEDTGTEAEVLELPTKLTSIEELSKYIGQHQSAQHEDTGHTPANLTPDNENEPVDTTSPKAPILRVDIDGLEETADAPDTPLETTLPLDATPPEDDAGTTDEATSEEPVADQSIPDPAATENQTDPEPERDSPTLTRASLSISRRMDRARLPIDLRTNIDGLHALSIDLNRLLSTSPPADLWRRYMNGEREVFTEHLLTWKETAAEDDIETTAASETFQRYAERYRKQFDETIKLARTSESGGEAVSEINGSDLSLVNDLLVGLDRRNS